MVVVFVGDDHTIFHAVDFARAQNPSIFADRHDDVAALRGQLLQKHAAALIRAMLAPLDRERVRFRPRGIAPDPIPDLSHLVRREGKTFATCERFELDIRSFARYRFGRERQRTLAHERLRFAVGAGRRVDARVTLDHLQTVSPLGHQHAAVEDGVVDREDLRRRERGVFRFEHERTADA